MKNIIIIISLLATFKVSGQNSVSTTYNGTEKCRVIWALNSDSISINSRKYKFEQSKSSTLKNVEGFIYAWNKNYNIYEKLKISFKYSEIDAVDLWRNGKKETFSNLQNDLR